MPILLVAQFVEAMQHHAQKNEFTVTNSFLAGNLIKVTDKSVIKT